jgi:hypothetical protein
MAIDLEAIKRKVAQLSGIRSSRVQLWKPQLGEHRIRVLPWADAAPESPFKERYFYYLGNEMPILAPFQFGKPDPINSFIKTLYASRKDEDKELAKKLRPAMRAYVPIVDRANEKDGVIVFAFGKAAYTRMLSFFLEKETENWNDPGEEGWDAKVQMIPNVGGFSKTKLGPIDLVRKQSPLHTDSAIAKKWLDSIPNIDDMYPIKSEAEIKQILERYLSGGSSDEDQGQGKPATERNSEKGADELEKLANELKSSPIPGPATLDEASEEDLPKKTPRKAAAAKKTTEEETETKFKNLDAAFDSLMAEE